MIVTGALLPEAMLLVGRNVMGVKMSHNLAVNDVLKSLAAYSLKSLLLIIWNCSLLQKGLKHQREGLG